MPTRTKPTPPIHPAPVGPATIKLFSPPSQPTNQTWFDSGVDRHHVAVFPLDRRDEALAMKPDGWTVQEGPEFFLCHRTDFRGADSVRT